MLMQVWCSRDCMTALFWILLVLALAITVLGFKAFRFQEHE